MNDDQTDILLWSEQQAALLRRRASGELINESALDWENIAEEIESVGSSERHMVESLLVQAMIHMLKMRIRPHARDRRHWEAEVAVFLGDAERRFSPAMAQRIDMKKLYANAVTAVSKSHGKRPPQSEVPSSCPWTLGELLQQPQA